MQHEPRHLPARRMGTGLRALCAGIDGRLEEEVGLAQGTLEQLLAGRQDLRVRHRLALARLLRVPPHRFLELGWPSGSTSFLSGPTSMMPGNTSGVSGSTSGLSAHTSLLSGRTWEEPGNTSLESVDTS